MPRVLVLGNRRCLFAYDGRGRIRDLFYPHVGQFNNLGGSGVRLGVWVEGSLSWLDEGWAVECETLQDSEGNLAGMWRFERDDMRIELTEWVDSVRPLLLRLIQVTNLAPHRRNIRLFSTQITHLRETDIGDCAVYDPTLSAIIHYKGDIYVAFGASVPVIQYTTGIHGFLSLEGTWRDAEDGKLSGQAIAQGSVDSTLRVDLDLDPQETAGTLFWIQCGKSRDDLVPPMGAMPKFEASSLYEKSVAIIEAHCDHHGAILAAVDSDIMATNRSNYAYCWMRDGALTSMALLKAGRTEPARDFLAFCARLGHDIPFYQKYHPDGTRGASWHPWVREGKSVRPCQEDETALPLVALYDYLHATGDVDFVRTAYEAFGKNADQFLLDHRDPSTGLPLPSYDLWEERFGVHTFTVATVVAGLKAASKIQAALGIEVQEGAEDVKAAMLKHLVGPHGFLRSFGDEFPDSSLLMLPLLGVIAADSEIMLQTATRIEKELMVHGGLARYPGDYYFRETDAAPGNPWPICTLWLAQYKLLIGKKEEGEALLQSVTSKATKSGMLAEQYSPVSGEPLSVMPLTWSHAEYVQACLALNPRAGRG